MLVETHSSHMSSSPLTKPAVLLISITASAKCVELLLSKSYKVSCLGTSWVGLGISLLQQGGAAQVVCNGPLLESLRTPT